MKNLKNSTLLSRRYHLMNLCSETCHFWPTRHMDQSILVFYIIENNSSERQNKHLFCLMFSILLGILEDYSFVLRTGVTIAFNIANGISVMPGIKSQHLAYRISSQCATIICDGQDRRGFTFSVQMKWTNMVR